jgi:hypothetical protein
VLIERCRLWLAPLADTENGFRAGTVPGENALDTKVAHQSPRARITIRDTQAWGFTNGMINLQAAFNLKENIDATVDRVTVWDSTIAFRLRGSNAGDSGAWVRIQNAVVYGVEVGIRYEDSIRRLRVWNTTFGRNVALPFDEELAGRSNPDVRNVVFLQAALPAEATGGPNLAVNHEAFVNAADDDYRLASHSPLIDAGTTIQDVTTDRAGLGRPQGRAYDIGAFELLKTEN